ncbi:MAG: DUF368 domain-containing protein [Bacteroidales bacterium]|nr:DUF368 domain-containing protein [Bacteroidales bacterium]MBQ8461946.1 DUF368 domain-containing protein [Bacteroidales bacterium]MCR5363125.1 DUF368 domain-containing protein [Bacteroidales bacterium]
MAAILSDIGNGLKGFAMGAANVIPGVSGGTIALITGIFGRIIDALNGLMSFKTWKLLFAGKFKEFVSKVDGRFLLAVMIGAVLSVFTLAKLMQYLLDQYPVQTWAFFLGMIAASAVFMLAEVRCWRVSYGLWIAVGIGLGIALCTLSPTETTDDLWFIFICGAIAICTMILPGVSGSFILLLLGKYEYIMNAISNLNWPVLAAFGIGCAIGIVAFSKALHWLLARYQQQTMLVLVGFVMGSLIKVWPWSDEALAAATAASDGSAPVTAGEMLIPGIIWIVIGIAAVVLLELAGKASRK